jgi:Uncharacterized protein conserved in bacteria (DUF2252)
MMQAATDVFLGWTRTPIDKRYFYIRRLKDSRLADIGTQLQGALPFYASLCGRTLARAHARAGDPALVWGYAGSGTAFEEAISEFAVAYGDQTEKDWNAFWLRSRLAASWRPSQRPRRVDAPGHVQAPRRTAAPASPAVRRLRSPAT